jgi:hypothetical protein
MKIKKTKDNLKERKNKCEMYGRIKEGRFQRKTFSYTLDSNLAIEHEGSKRQGGHRG